MKRRLQRSLLLASVCSAAALALACDSAIPTAPSGTILTISANPSQISLNGSSTITVVGRKPNGSPLNEGTEIFFSTDLGSINPAVAAVDEDGVARTTLRGDGRVGTAAVQARVGTGSTGEGGTGTASTEVQIGRNAASLSLQATPSSVADRAPSGTSQTVRLIALVRDSSGQPLAGAPTNFQTTVGTLASGGSFITTNNLGEARDTLTVTNDQLSAVNTDTFAVSAEAGGEGGATVEDTFSVRIDRPLRADFTANVNGLSVSFTDQSTGNPSSHFWDFGDGGTSTQANPSHTYAAADTYTVVLTVRNALGTDSEVRDITVPQ